MSNENQIPSGWIETTLGEVCFFVSEKIKVSEINLSNYVSTENLLENRNGKVNAENLPSISKVNQYEKGDTLFSNIRTYFRKVWFSTESGGASNDVLVFRALEPSQLNSKFLFYLISNEKFIDFTVKSAKGTKMPRGDKSAIKQYNITIPPLTEQKAIAKILSSFDDKIELLQAQNKTLEDTAQTIFKEWFGKYQIGDELPEGWRVGKLGEVAKHIKENIKPFNNPLERYIHYSLPAYDDGLKPIVEFGETIKSNKYQLVDKSFLVSKLNPFTPRIWTIFNAEKNYICSTEFQIIKPKFDKYFSLIHCFLNSKYFTAELSQKIKGTSSSHQRVNPQDIFDASLILPDSDKLKRFNLCVYPLIEKKEINYNQIQTLKKTRDTLLPKLMSGKLRVNEFKN